MYTRIADKLKELGADDVVILDMEAGIEHFGRGTGMSCDKVIMVVDPSYESLKLSAKITEICSQIGKTVYYVINKADEDSAEFMKSKINDPEMIACIMPQNRELKMAGLTGEALDGEYEEIKTLIDKIA